VPRPQLFKVKVPFR